MTLTLAELRTAACHYEWLERRLFEVLGGWVPTVAEPEVKLLLRRHSFQHAWHAELWAELAPPHGDLNAARTAALGPVLDAVSAPSDTVERLAGAYGVVLPALLSAYRELAADAAAAGPLRRVLTLVLADDAPAAAEGAAQLLGLGDDATAAAHQLVVLERLAGSGGVKSAETC